MKTAGPEARVRWALESGRSWASATHVPDSLTPEAKQKARLHYTRALEQTARFCGMHWAPPFVLHAGHRLGADALQQAIDPLRQQARALQSSLEGRP